VYLCSSSSVATGSLALRTSNCNACAIEAGPRNKSLRSSALSQLRYSLLTDRQLVVFPTWRGPESKAVRSFRTIIAYTVKSSRLFYDRIQNGPPIRRGLLGGKWPAVSRKSRAPSGHPDNCLVCISLTLLRRVWSKLAVQVVVKIWFSGPSKAWVSVVYSSTVPTVNPFALRRPSEVIPTSDTAIHHVHLRVC